MYIYLLDGSSMAFTMTYFLLSFLPISVFGLLLTAYLFYKVTCFKNTHERSAHIASLIRDGAMTFIYKEYMILSIVIAIAAAVLFFGFNIATSLAYVFGALSSMFAGWVGMKAATRSNEATTLAARDRGERAAFLTAVLGGSVMGFMVASLGLLGLGTVFYLFIGETTIDFIRILTAFALGASSIALFARVGGGIYTKAADVGADLVGKVEMGIPEDDPRNPAVIADNVGDCVGDTAGMGADIFESYVGAVVGSIALALGIYGNQLEYVTLPITLCAIGLVGSLIGLLSTLVFNFSLNLMLHSAAWVAIAAFIAGSYAYLAYMSMDMVFFGSIFLGAASGLVISAVTDYYTSGSPIRKLAESSKSGAGTNLIYGLSIGFESVVAPVVAIAVIMFISFTYFGGFFGVSLAAVSMLATVGITMTIDAYGPIADNAGGISEMAGFGPEVRKITDKLDALGNMTAALGKGFAIGSAVFASLALFAAYCELSGIPVLDLKDPIVLAGLFIGATLPYLISAFTMRAVGRAAWKMVIEVRRQFKEITGLMEGHVEPDYKRCIDISTKAALLEMLAPGLITLLLPIAIKFGLGANGNLALGGFLAGATISGVVLALMMANAGGAWDNAKKYISAGNFGGKGSDAYKAAVVGDTVGDPFKDTSGPSLNIVIKLMSIISLLLATI